MNVFAKARTKNRPASSVMALLAKNGFMLVVLESPLTNISN